MGIVTGEDFQVLAIGTLVQYVSYVLCTSSVDIVVTGTCS
jgi:hypothetical protein